MRALVLLALAAAAAAGADSDSEVTVNVGTDDEERAVKDAAKLRAALAKGDPVVELWDDILLDGAPAIATHDAVIEGNNYVIYQTSGARHFVSNGTRLELKNLQLKTGGHPSPAPTKFSGALPWCNSNIRPKWARLTNLGSLCTLCS